MKSGFIYRFASWCMLVFITTMLVACNSKDSGSDKLDELAAGTRVIPIRVARAETREILVELHAVGRLVSQNSPSLAAEIDARVVEILVEEGEAVAKGQELVLLDETRTELARREALADIERLKATIDNEQRRVIRYRDLKTKDMMPQERLDDAEAQLAVSHASLSAAEARLANTQDRLTRARVRSPFDGVVEKRHVSVGDFAPVGRQLITVIDTRALWARLPFPETVGYQLREGLEIFIESAIAPGQIVQARIDQIRPGIGTNNKALIVIADVINPGFWRPEATIEARVVVERRPDAIVVPTVSVVARPAGNVVYQVESDQVRERVVETGEMRDGWIEIRSGLAVGITVATEGAYYLTDGAAVSVSGAAD